MKSMLKSCIRKLTRNIRIRIRSGPCQGLLWSLPTRMNFIRGIYEQRFANFIAATLRPDDVFWDVGAHFGYYTLLASQIVQRGQCVSFEPDSDNRWYLEHHIRWNRLKNMTVLPFAIAETNGLRKFGGDGTGAGRLDSGGQEVQTRSIDSLVKTHTCQPPSFLKIDVEGAEAEVLNGELTHSEAGMVCVATHGPNVHTECGKILMHHGYRVHDLRKEGLLIGTGQDRPVSDATLKIISGETPSTQSAQLCKT